jgi:hypothetical protein
MQTLTFIFELDRVSLYFIFELDCVFSVSLYVHLRARSFVSFMFIFEVVYGLTYVVCNLTLALVSFMPGTVSSSSAYSDSVAP